METIRNIDLNDLVEHNSDLDLEFFSIVRDILNEPISATELQMHMRKLKKL